MHIDSTGFPMNQIPSGDDTIRKPGIPVQPSQKPQQKTFEKAVSDSVKPVRSSQFKSLNFNQPLSNYLSSEEKGMLQSLFPSSSQGFGIGAYQNGQQTIQRDDVVGKQIDIIH